MGLKWLLNFVIVIGYALVSSPCGAQDVDPVIWSFKVVEETGQESTFYATATLAPGWHMYSQFLKEGGPVPTTFKFRHDEAVYTLAGTTREYGEAVKFYDDTYGMEIVWYPRQVIFEQALRLLKPHGSISGVVEFMVCNDEMCIPSERDFFVKW
jgi:hypothetical protein